ncbi:MAG: Mpo1-like protein [Chitinophagales bacterium]
MKTIQSWLDEYAESHQNPTNKAVHFICVPTIFFTIVGLLYSIKLPFHLPIMNQPELNVAEVVLVLVAAYYAMLSLSLAVGMVLFSLFCLMLCRAIDHSGIAPLWIVCLVLFVIAWIFQFWGHNIEGKKPSFLKDIQFLMIGPAWVMSYYFSKLGISL